MRQLASPWFLLLSLLVLPLVWIIVKRIRSRFPGVSFTAIDTINEALHFNLKAKLRHIPLVLSLISLLLLTIVLARPQSVSQGQDVHSEGIDIVIALDISASMRARDLTPDRVGAAKDVASDFISARPNDRIGIVLFAKQAFTQCPLTIDHSILLELIDQVKIGLVDPDNTAIGHALASALNRIKDSESKSKVIILLTDGENNFGLPPTTAAEAAEALGIRIYTIGIGTRGTAPYPSRDMFGRPSVQMVQVSIDEELLKEIAASTGGQYFRATNNEKLKRIFEEIDQMERTRIEVRAFRKYAELFYPWAKAALILLTIALLMQTFVIRGIS